MSKGSSLSYILGLAPNLLAAAFGWQCANAQTKPQTTGVPPVVIAQLQAQGDAFFDASAPGMRNYYIKRRAYELESGTCAYVLPVRASSALAEAIAQDKKSRPRKTVTFDFEGVEWLLATVDAKDEELEDQIPMSPIVKGRADCIDPSKGLPARTYGEYQGPEGACESWAICSGKAQFLVCPSSGPSRCPSAEHCRDYQKFAGNVPVTTQVVSSGQDSSKKTFLVGRNGSNGKTHGFCIGPVGAPSEPIALSATTDGTCPSREVAAADRCITGTDYVTIAPYASGGTSSVVQPVINNETKGTAIGD